MAGALSLPAEIIQKIYGHDGLNDLESRLRGQAVCKAMAQALAITPQLPCTLAVKWDDPPAKLAWVASHRPPVSKLVVVQPPRQFLERRASIVAERWQVVAVASLLAVSPEALEEVVSPLPGHLIAANFFSNLRKLDIALAEPPLIPNAPRHATLPAGMSALRHLRDLSLGVPACRVDLRCGGPLGALTRLRLSLESSGSGGETLRLNWPELPALRDLAVCGHSSGDSGAVLELDSGAAAAVVLPRLERLSLEAPLRGADWRPLLPQLRQLRLGHPCLIAAAQLGAATQLTRLELLSSADDGSPFGLSTLPDKWAELLDAVGPTVRSLGVHSRYDRDWPIWNSVAKLAPTVLYIYGPDFPSSAAPCWASVRALYVEGVQHPNNSWSSLDLGGARQLEVLQAWPAEFIAAGLRASQPPARGHVQPLLQQSSMGEFLDTHEGMAAAAAAEEAAAAEQASAAICSRELAAARAEVAAAAAERLRAREEFVGAQDAATRQAGYIQDLQRHGEAADAKARQLEEELEQVRKTQARWWGEVSKEEASLQEAQAAAEAAREKEVAACAREEEARALLAQLQLRS